MRSWRAISSSSEVRGRIGAYPTSWCEVEYACYAHGWRIAADKSVPVMAVQPHYSSSRSIMNTPSVTKQPQPATDSIDAPDQDRAPDGAGPHRFGFASVSPAVLYALISFYLYHGLWSNPTRSYLTLSANDQTLFEWLFTKAAHDLVHLTNPLSTGLLNAPEGVNLMANTAMLGLALPLAPLTLLAGAGVTWTLLMTGGLAATAFSWYWLAAKYVTTSRTGALLAGGFCAFAPAMVSHATAHPNLTVQFMIPVIIDRLLRLRHSQSLPRDGAVLGLFITYQVFIGEELLFIAAIGIALFALGYAAVHGAQASRFAGPLTRGTAVAGGVALTLLAYPLAHQFFGSQSYRLKHDAANEPGAFLAFPGQSLAGDAEAALALAGNSVTEQNSFLGWPLLVIVCGIVIWLLDRPMVKVFAGMTIAAAVLSLGARGPWSLVDYLPLFRSIVEGRLALICVVGIAMLLALAVERLAAHPNQRVCDAGALALACALMPIAPTPYPTHERDAPPAFITSGLWKSYVHPGRTLVPVPVPDNVRAGTMQWQMRANMGFAIPGGYFVGPIDKDGNGWYGPILRPTAKLLLTVSDTGRIPDIGPEQRRQARKDLAYWRADAVVLPPQPHKQELQTTVDRLLDERGTERAGVHVWRV